MPLSEDEQRQLDLIAKSLYDEDPTFASGLSGRGAPGVYKARGVLGVVLVLIGLAVIIGGVAVQQTILGAGGFLVALVGAVMAYSAMSAPHAPDDI